MKQLLQEMIDAGKNPTLPLEMLDWVSSDVNSCGTACCLCGDVGIKRMNPKDNHEMLKDAFDEATKFADELDEASMKVFGNNGVANSIYCGTDIIRLCMAEDSGVFTKEELNHPHLTSDHNDREIAHDYIRLVMRKVEEKLGETS